MKSLLPSEVAFLKELAAGKASGDIATALKVCKQRVWQLRQRVRQKLDMRPYATDVEMVKKWESMLDYP